MGKRWRLAWKVVDLPKGQSSAAEVQEVLNAAGQDSPLWHFDAITEGGGFTRLLFWRWEKVKRRG